MCPKERWFYINDNMKEFGDYSSINLYEMVAML
jgi:hypothetical protein